MSMFSFRVDNVIGLPSHSKQAAGSLEGLEIEEIGQTGMEFQGPKFR